MSVTIIVEITNKLLRHVSTQEHLQYKLIGFYNRDEKCLLRGTNWVFI